MTASVARRLAMTLLALLLAALAACSSGDGGGSEAADRESESTGSTAEGGEGSADELNAEQCTAFQSLGDAAALDEAVAIFPEELQDDVQQFGEERIVAETFPRIAFLDSVESGTGEPTAPQPEPTEALANAAASCRDDDGSDGGVPGPATATFTYRDLQIAGDTAVIQVSGACSDGSFPTDVELSYGPFGDVAPGVDAGGGEYEFTVDVVAGAIEENLVVELGLEPESIEYSITSTCG